MNSQAGFTLLEFLITTVIAVILFAIAVPGFESITQANRLTTASNDFVASLHLAKSEAIKRSQQVSVCKKNTQTATCDTNSEWDDGWLVFVDLDRDGDLDTPGRTASSHH